MSWQDWVQLVAAVVAAFAAVGAIVFAWLTVRESSKLRQEDRYARLAEIIGDYGAILARAEVDDEASDRLLPTLERLRAHVTAANEPLPACQALLHVNADDPWQAKADATEAALAEIGKRLGR